MEQIDSESLRKGRYFCAYKSIYMLYLQPDVWITTRRGAGLASRLLNFMEDKAWASPGELGLLGIAVF